MVELSVRNEQRERWEHALADVRTAVIGAPTGSAAWCAAPYLVALQDRRPSRGLPLLIERQEHLRHIALSATGSRSLRVELFDSALAVGNSRNQWRVLEPVLASIAPPGRRRTLTLRPAWAAITGLTEADRQRAKRLADAMHGERLSDRRVAHRAIRKAVRARAVAERLMGDLQIDRLVVGTQHDVEVRAFLAAARRHGIPSVYVPHAPLAVSAIYDDLPVDLAVLRGRRELEHYLALDVDATGLTIAGNPGISEVPADVTTTIDENGPIVLALSWPLDDLTEELVALVESATSESVLVAPHPVSDRAAVRRLLPSHWTLPPADQRTWDVLRDGPSCVLQSSSGVALEALSLGLYTVQLDVPGAPPAYPVIAEPAVRFARSTEQLRAVLDDRVPQNRHDPRRQRIAEAAAWCDGGGTVAVQRCVEAMEAVVLRPRPLLDAWSPNP